MQSDLAIEFSKTLTKTKDYTKTQKQINQNVKSTIIEIKTDKAKQEFQREKGHYFLIEMPLDFEKQKIQKNIIQKEITRAIKYLMKKISTPKINSCLVVGLGNPNMSADYFGNKVVNNILASRHIIKSGLVENVCEISKITCNVFGQTGIESFDVVKGIAEKIKPQIVICIDTLVANSFKRLCSNIQIANVGIIPGSGANNARKEISKDTLKVDVITIGIPFVCYAEDLVYDYLKFNNNLKNNSKNLKNNQKNDKKIEKNENNLMFYQNFKELIVMPKDIEQQVDFCSGLVADGINAAFYSSKTIKILKKVLQ